MQPAVRAARRTFMAGLASLALLVLAVAPVSADIERGHKGHVGPHSLRDTQRRAGASCTYKTITEQPSDYAPGATYYEGRLGRLDVKPPLMQPAFAFRQKLGWRFIVERARDDAAFKVIYRSPVQTARAMPGKNAAFLPMGVRVSVPEGSRHENHHTYRVVVKMFWYAPDGRVSGTARHQVSWYALVLRGQFERTWPPACDAWTSWIFPAG